MLQLRVLRLGFLQVEDAGVRAAVFIFQGCSVGKARSVPVCSPLAAPLPGSRSAPPMYVHRDDPLGSSKSRIVCPSKL